MNIHLLIYIILNSLDVLLGLLYILFVFFKAKKDVVRITLILLLLCLIIYPIGHIFGFTVSDGNLSRKILMLNLVLVFVPSLTAHFVFSVLGKQKEQKNIIKIFYIISFAFFTFFILNPYYYLENSIPKLYFPNYYVPGPHYPLMLLFFLGVPVYFSIIMIKVYLTSNEIEKNRIRYFIFSILLAYPLGSANFFLFYNISFDPLWASLCLPAFAIPFTYAALQYELMDIKIVAKNAFIYSIASVAIGSVLIFLNYINNLLIQSSPGFPSWIFPIILAFVMAGAIFIVWRKIREEDVLKYEFVNTVIHKFRTPLTAIKWSNEDLIKSDFQKENQKEDVSRIQKSTENLVDLTSLLVNLSTSDEKTFEYNFTKINLNKFIENLLPEYSEEIKIKNIILAPSFNNSDVYILADEQKLKFVFQTLLDNSIKYSKQDGKILAEIRLDGNSVVVKITDDGIGISKEEIKLVFRKFYRTESGKKADTEGMGIGLYLTKKIVEKHNGKIWVESEGEGKGSSFFVSLPIEK